MFDFIFRKLNGIQQKICMYYIPAFVGDALDKTCLGKLHKVEVSN